MNKTRRVTVGIVLLMIGVVWVGRPSAMTATIQANAASLGAIPDGPAGCTLYGTSRNVTFTVAGVRGKVSAVKVSFMLAPAHGSAGDLEVFLFSPLGVPHLLLARTGATSALDVGDDTDVAGTYSFHDAAGGNWWGIAALLDGSTAMPPGDYRTSSVGEAPSGGSVTAMNPVFSGVNPNGTWTLRFRDHCQNNTGTVVSASLALATSIAPVDFEGNRQTDWSVVRNTGGGPTGATTWYWQNSIGITGRLWGIATDFFVPDDYDGDGKSDVAVWRQATTSVWYINRSSDLGATIFPFGTTNDDPTVAGDYDGDGKADMALYRPGAAPGQASFWYIWRSSSASLLVFPWGQNVDYPAPGDYDGDGKFDYALQRNEGGGIAVFHILRSGPGGYMAVAWGTPSDLIVPGDYDGDGITDVAVVRNNAGALEWHVRRSSDGGYTGIAFGASGDRVCQGDYDGDGKTDVAVWRPNADPALTAFYVLWSSNGSVHAQQFGQLGDFPVANYNSR